MDILGETQSYNSKIKYFPDREIDQFLLIALWWFLDTFLRVFWLFLHHWHYFFLHSRFKTQCGETVHQNYTTENPVSFAETKVIKQNLKAIGTSPKIPKPVPAVTSPVANDPRLIKYLAVIGSSKPRGQTSRYECMSSTLLAKEVRMNPKEQSTVPIIATGREPKRLHNRPATGDRQKLSARAIEPIHTVDKSREITLLGSTLFINNRWKEWRKNKLAAFW